MDLKKNIIKTAILILLLTCISCTKFYNLKSYIYGKYIYIFEPDKMDSIKNEISTKVKIENLVMFTYKISEKDKNLESYLKNNEFAIKWIDFNNKDEFLIQNQILRLNQFLRRFKENRYEYKDFDVHLLNGNDYSTYIVLFFRSNFFNCLFNNKCYNRAVFLFENNELYFIGFEEMLHD